MKLFIFSLISLLLVNFSVCWWGGHRTTDPPYPPVVETDCVVSDWSEWSDCLPHCDDGIRTRHRTVLVRASLFGVQCPRLTDDEDCGGWNGDCDHHCNGNTGKCSCDSGYELVDDTDCDDINECDNNNGNCQQRCRNFDGGYKCKCYSDHHELSNGTCVSDDCQMPQLPNCPANSYKDAFGPACQDVNVHCPHGTHTGEQCQLLCSRGYSVAKILPGSNSGLFGRRYHDAQFTGLSHSVTCNQVHLNDIIPGWSSSNELLNYYCRRINDPPNDISLSHSTLLENSPSGTIVGALTATDQQTNQAMTFSVISSTSSSSFEVKNGALVSKWVPIWQSGASSRNTYTVTIRASDDGTPVMWYEKDFQITITNQNDPPGDIQLSNDAVQESIPVNTVVGDLSAIDRDGPTGNIRSTAFTWTLLTNDAERFSIQRGYQITVEKKLTDVAGTTRTFTVRCSDRDASNPKYSDKLLSVTVLSAAAPNSTLTVALYDIPENVAAGHNSALVLLLMNPVSQSVTFEMTSSPKLTRDAFNLGHVACNFDATRSRQSCMSDLVTTELLNYETKSSYPLTVIAKVDDVEVAQASVVVQITDINEKPISFQLSTNIVEENSIPGTNVAKITVNDPDIGQTHNCSINPQRNTALPFAVKGQYIIISSSVDFEKKAAYDVIINCSDNGSPPMFIADRRRIDVEDVNEPPYSLIITNMIIKEDVPISTIVGVIIANDHEQSASSLTYSISQGSDYFQITGTTAPELRVKTILDHETTPIINIMLKATDSGGLSMEKHFTINVQDVNEPPTDMFLSKTSVNENTAENVFVSSIVVIDPETNLDATCSMVTVNPHFKINGVSLLAGSTPIDYESMGDVKAFSLTIKCLDNRANSITKQVTINVTDINERPSDILLQTTAFKEDNSPVNSIIGTISVTDSDNNQSHVCTLPANQTASPFVTINGMDIKLISPVNFEAYHKLPLRIHCRDVPSIPGMESLGINRDFSIPVEDVNEKPLSPCAEETYVSESSSNNTMVHIYVSPDPDNEEYEIMKSKGMPPSTWFIKQKLTYSLVSGTSSSLPFIMLQDGTLITNQALNATSAKTYTLRIYVADDGKLKTLPNNIPTIITGPTLSDTFTCTVKIVPATDGRLSTGLSLSSTNVLENSPAQTFIGQLSTTISQFDEVFDYSIIGSAPDAPFSIINNKLLVSGKRDLDHEKTSIIGVGIAATGSKGTSLRKYFDINIIDVNEDATKLCLVPNAVKEYSPSGSLVGQLVIEDPDVPLSIGNCARQLTNTETNNKYTCEFNADNQKALRHLQSMFLIEAGNVLHANRSFVRADATSYTLPIICKEKLQSGKFINEVIAVQITASGCPDGQRPDTKGCVCANGLLGLKCDRNPSLCQNIVCNTQEVCLTVIHSDLRCVATPNQLPILLRVPFDKTKSDGYMYNFEAYVENILRGVKSDKTIADVRGRSRRSLSSVYVEGMQPISVKSNYSYVVLVAMDPDNSYQFMLADNVCKLFAGSDIRCVNAADCLILKEVGIECPYTYVTGGTGQLGKGDDDGTSGRASGSSLSWVYIVIGLALVIVLLVIIIGILYRRRSTVKDHVAVVYRHDDSSMSGRELPIPGQQDQQRVNQVYMDIGEKKPEIAMIGNPTYADASSRRENDYATIPSHHYMEPPPAYEEDLPSKGAAGLPINDSGVNVNQIDLPQEELVENDPDWYASPRVLLQ